MDGLDENVQVLALRDAGAKKSPAMRGFVVARQVLYPAQPFACDGQDEAADDKEA